MNLPDTDPFYDALRNRLHDYEEPLPAGGWAGIAPQLPPPPPPRAWWQRRPARRLSVLLLLLLLLVPSALVLWRRTAPESGLGRVSTTSRSNHARPAPATHAAELSTPQSTAPVRPLVAAPVPPVPAAASAATAPTAKASARHQIEGEALAVVSSRRRFRVVVSPDQRRKIRQSLMHSPTTTAETSAVTPTLAAVVAPADSAAATAGTLVPTPDRGKRRRSQEPTVTGAGLPLVANSPVTLAAKQLPQATPPATTEAGATPASAARPAASQSAVTDAATTATVAPATTSTADPNTADGAGPLSATAPVTLPEAPAAATTDQRADKLTARWAALLLPAGALLPTPLPLTSPADSLPRLRPARLSLGVLLSVAPTRRSSGSAPTELRRQEQPGLGASAEAAARYQLTRQLAVRTGLGYATQQQQLAYTLEKHQTYWRSVSNLIVRNNPAGPDTLQVLSYTRHDSVLSRQHLQYQLAQHYLTVPLAAEWHPRTPLPFRWQPILSLGATASWLLSGRYLTASAEGCNCEVQTQRGGVAGPFRPVSLALNAGLGLDYALGLRSTLLLRSTASYWPTAAGGTRPLALGLQVGLLFETHRPRP